MRHILDVQYGGPWSCQKDANSTDFINYSPHTLRRVEKLLSWKWVLSSG